MLKKNKKLTVAVLALLAVVGTVAIAAEVVQNTGPSGTWRYKVTVSVETPEGIKTGSAVREVHVELEPRPDYRPYPFHPVVTSKGEAAVVDLGQRGVLFALTGPDDYRTVFEAFPSGHGGTTPPAVEYYNQLKSAKAVLEPGPLPNPILVTFKDVRDPTSVTIVDPSSLSSAFGKGVYLRDVTIEMTDEELTRMVDKYLPSLSADTGWDWLRRLPYGDPRRIGPDSFK